MALNAHLRSWSGEALRHVSAGARFGVLDFRYAGRGADNRWNEPGEPTLYLASDMGVAIAEFGRHFAVNRTPGLGQETIERTVYRLSLGVERVLDLRRPDVYGDLPLEDAPNCFLSIPIARATAHFIRSTTDAQGLLVPSVAFLDNLDRWCLVLFLDKLSPDPDGFISSVAVEGPLRWR